jgi:hypothetical protein
MNATMNEAKAAIPFRQPDIKLDVNLSDHIKKYGLLGLTGIAVAGVGFLLPEYSWHVVGSMGLVMLGITFKGISSAKLQKEKLIEAEKERLTDLAKLEPEYQARYMSVF